MCNHFSYYAVLADAKVYRLGRGAAAYSADALQPLLLTPSLFASASTQPAYGIFLPLIAPDTRRAVKHSLRIVFLLDTRKLFRMFPVEILQVVWIKTIGLDQIESADRIYHNTGRKGVPEGFSWLTSFI